MGTRGMTKEIVYSIIDKLDSNEMDSMLWAGLLLGGPAISIVSTINQDKHVIMALYYNHINQQEINLKISWGSGRPHYNWKDIHIDVQKVFNNLSDYHKNLLFLKLSGYSFREIEDIIGMSKTSIGADFKDIQYIFRSE